MGFILAGLCKFAPQACRLMEVVMTKKYETCIKMLRQLVSDVQGAPYPSENFEPELYKIWYEHVQRAAVECFEFLDDNFPQEKENFDKTLKKMFK